MRDLFQEMLQDAKIWMEAEDFLFQISEIKKLTKECEQFVFERESEPNGALSFVSAVSMVKS